MYKCTECGTVWEDSPACNSWGHCFKFGDCSRHIDIKQEVKGLES